MLRARVTGSQRSRSLVQTAVILLVVSTVLITLTSVKHLASAIASRQALPEDSGISGAIADSGSRKRLQLSQDVVDGGLPHASTDARITQATVKADAHPEKVANAAVDAKPVVGHLELPASNASSRTGSDAFNIASSEANSSCTVLPNTDYWGEPVKWGPDNKQESAEACCKACQDFKPKTAEDMDCNVWVHCGDKGRCAADYQSCWLKHLPHPGAVVPRTGPEVAWTSGIITRPAQGSAPTHAQNSSEDRRYHIVITAQGEATHWQARVHYYWFQKVKAQCEAAGKCDMGGFTRILHSGQPDELMDEVPTFVATPLPDEHNQGYVVLNRPYAFVQWLQGTTIPEKYVFMSEPDHIWLKPMPNLMVGERPAAFPFFYIEPSKTEFLPLTQKFTGPLTRRQAEDIPPIGNAPSMLSLAQLQRVAPTWMNTSSHIFNDAEAHKEWNWVLEMYGFAISCYNTGVVPMDLHLKMMSQPPWDEKLEPYYLLHYTYGMDYTLEGIFTPGKIGAWRFDKRSYSVLPPPRNLDQPPVGMKNELVRHLINALNEATDKIPGWDEYSRSGRATQLWNGNL